MDNFKIIYKILKYPERWEIVDRPVRELTEQERKENANIL